MDSQDFELQLLDGALNIRNAPLNTEWLNSYFLNLGVSITEGLAREVSVEIESYIDGYGEFIIDGLELTIIASSEDGLVFYDALESSIIYAPAPLAPLDQLARDIPVGELNLDEDGQRPAKLLGSAFYSFIERFRVTCRNVMLRFIGSQTHHVLTMNFPFLELYQPRGFNEISLDLPEGINLDLYEKERRTSVLKVGDNTSATINIDDFNDIRVKLKCKGADLEVPLETLRVLQEFHLTYWKGSPTDRGVTKPGPGRAFNLALSCEISRMQSKLSGLKVVFQDLLLTLDSDQRCAKCLQVAAVSDNDETLTKVANLMIAWRWPCVIDFQCDSFAMNNDLAILSQSIENYASVLAENKAWVAHSDTTFVANGKIAVLSVEFEAGEGLPQVKSVLESLEFNYEARRLALHFESGRLDIGPNSMLLSRASFYSSKKEFSFAPTSRGELWPFSELVKIVEGRQVISTIDDPEEYFIFRSRTLESAQTHWHASAESLKICGNLTSLQHALGLLKSNVALDPSLLHDVNGWHCISVSIGQLDITEASLEISFDGSAVELFYSKGRALESFDFRCDYNSILWSHPNDQKMFLARKVLIASLDSHFKPLILTLHRQENKAIFSASVYGGLITLPIFSEPFEALKKSLFNAYQRMANSGSGGRIPKSLHINLNLCSVRLHLPLRHERVMPPHTLYFERARVIFSEADRVVFLQKGEIFMAQSPKCVRTVTGLFGEGHNYWEEQNYEAISRFDFVMACIESEDEDITLRLEDNLLVLDLHTDSISVGLRCIDLYLRMFREQRLAESTDSHQRSKEEKVLLGDGQILSESSGTDNEDDLLGGTEALFSLEETLQERLSIDDDFYSSETLKATVEDDPWGGLAHLIELETATRESITEQLEVVSEPLEVVPEHLEIDQDFFSGRLLEGNTEFPFKADRVEVKGRLQIKDFSIKVRLLEGKQWHANHRSQIVREPSMSSMDGLNSVLGRSISDVGRSNSQLSSSASSKWSHLMSHTPSRTGSSLSLLTRDSVELLFSGINAELDWSSPFPRDGDNLGPEETFLTAIRLISKNVEVIDRVRSSRWKSLVARRTIKGDSLASSMIKLEINSFFVDKKDQSEQDCLPEDHLESTVDVELEPLRVHIDQDTLIFLIRFAEALSHSQQRSSFVKEGAEDNPVRPAFLQKFKLSELSIRMDYKPKKVNVRKAMGGSYFEFLNLFDLEDADLHLPAVTLTGINGTEDLLGKLLRAWLPYVKNTQIPQVVGGITPVKTVKNLGGGFTDLILLPIEQYKKNGRIVHGLRKGATSFLHSTTLELARMGSKLAIGAQTLLEHADDIVENDPAREEERAERSLGIATTSKYSSPPADVGEGVFSALHSMKGSLQSAAETIIAVPVQVYERKGPGGAAKAVLRAIPVAVLRTAMGASEAMGKALIGVESSLDPARGMEIKRKYKSREDRYSKESTISEEEPPYSASLDRLGSSFPLSK